MVSVCPSRIAQAGTVMFITLCYGDSFGQLYL